VVAPCAAYTLRRRSRGRDVETLVAVVEVLCGDPFRRGIQVRSAVDRHKRIRDSAPFLAPFE